MTVLDILASIEIHSLARGCVFSYRLSQIYRLLDQAQLLTLQLVDSKQSYSKAKREESTKPHFQGHQQACL